MTSSRTRRKRKFTSRPGVFRLATRAVAYGTVPSVAVLGGGAFLRRVGDEGRPGRLDPGEAAADRALADRALHLVDEGIVAAGVEKDEAEAGRTVDRGHHPGEGDGLVLDIGVALERGVDRDEIIDAVDLDAVAGIVDHGDLGAARLVLEIAERPAQVVGGQVVEMGDIEADVGEGLGHVGGVIDRVGENPDRDVVAVADDQRDAHALGRCIGPGMRTEEARKTPRKTPKLRAISVWTWPQLPKREETHLLPGPSMLSAPALAKSGNSREGLFRGDLPGDRGIGRYLALAGHDRHRLGRHATFPPGRRPGRHRSPIR